MLTHHLETQTISGGILKKIKQLSSIAYHFTQTPKKLKRLPKVCINHIHWSNSKNRRINML